MSVTKMKYDQLEEFRRKNEILANIVNKLIVFDKKRIFLYPVNVQYVPDYLNIIKEPMDFTTMKQKIQNFKYNTYEEFERDIFLIINNCYTYNDKTTIYHKIAEGLEAYYKKLSVKMYRKYMSIHVLYHNEDKNLVNKLLYNTNIKDENLNTPKDNKKGIKPKKYGKVGRPNKANMDYRNNQFNDTDMTNANMSKRRKNTIKNSMKSNEYMGDNSFYNANGSYNNNFMNGNNNNNYNINNMYGYDQMVYNLENMIDEENFDNIIDTIVNSNEKSKDIFNILIKSLKNKDENCLTSCNYVNIPKTLHRIYFDDSAMSKLRNKNIDRLLADNIDNINIDVDENHKKRERYNTNGALQTDNKKSKLLNQKQSINDHYESNLNTKTHNENYNNQQCSNSDLTKHLDLNKAENSYYNYANHNSNKVITCNIENQELTMNFLNYKESVKKFIGKENLSAFIDIFPNINNILDNTDSKDLYYYAFNDLRLFGVDVPDFDEFNKKIVYNENYLLGIGRHHINNILTLDKNLVHVLQSKNNKTKFCNKLKEYLSNNKKREKYTSNKCGNNHNSNENTEKLNDDYDPSNMDRKNSNYNLKTQFDIESFSSDSSLNDENLNLRNFLGTYNYFHKESIKKISSKNNL
ncbi:bromodomain protein, putative [Plasmodium vinckei vinckei]|uniref:Bromodomain protein, putative n=1 Tax=Plasmodium vinckei vinckei TaxID=54757 RepID=A0A449BXC7_PLAVN|nr:bromodomain protein, putative [Plasmodium vinckei vinckei]VEV58088.1 bromodomain protein, putative [Plasmodium vinckei vinckei]